jgi:fermentation-respiration switch protein FrsA (DUF1100 family)
MAVKRSVYRVNYYLGGSPASAFVCAYSDSEASGFMGVTDGSASVTTVASPVEVAGVDAAHPALAPNPIFIAPPEAPAQVSREEFNELLSELAQVKAQLSGGGKTVLQPAPPSAAKEPFTAV